MKRSLLIVMLLLLSVLIACTNEKDNTVLQQEEVRKVDSPEGEEAVEAEGIKDLTIEEKVEDFEYLFDIIMENHPLLEVNKRVNGTDWESKKDDYLERVKQSRDDQGFYRVMDSALKDVNNGHTHMVNPKDAEMFRLAYYYMGDSYRLEMLNHERVLRRYDMEVLEYDGTPAQQPENAFSLPRVNAEAGDILEDRVGYIYLPQMIQPYERMRDEELISNYLSRIKDYPVLIIDVRENRGGSPGYWSDFLVPRIIGEEKSFEVYTFMREGSIFSRWLEMEPINDEGLKEAGLNSIENLNPDSLPNLPPEITDFARFIKKEYVVSPHEDTINYSGEIYLLVDKVSYSAADLLAVFAKDTDFATLVGETTGGGGISDEPWLEMLPNSGYLFRFPLMMGTTSDGTVIEEHKTIPDYGVNFPKRNKNLSYDLAIQKVLELEGLE